MATNNEKPKLTLDKIYLEAAWESYKAAGQIGDDPYKRAMAFATLALGLSSQVKPKASAEIETKIAEALTTLTKAEESEEPATEEAKEKTSEAEEASVEEAPEPKKKVNKYKKRPTKKDDAEPAEEVPKETPKEESEESKKEEKKPEPEIDPETFTEEWTPAAMEYFAKELAEENQLGDIFNFLYPDNPNMMDEMVAYALDNDNATEKDINPLNIRAVVEIISSALNETLAQEGKDKESVLKEMRESGKAKEYPL